MSQIDVITNRIIALIFPADEPNPLSFSDPSIPTIPHPRPARSERTRKLVHEFFVPLSRLSAEWNRVEAEIRCKVS